MHYDAAAVDHVFRVAAGLDSMVVGEAQILGQLRDAYHCGHRADTAGRLLHELMQQALRVGKRAHAETGIDRAGQSVVTAALDLAAAHLDGDLAGRPALVVGAGAMGALGVATLSRLGAGAAHRHQPGRRPGRPAGRVVRRHRGADRRAGRRALHSGHRSGRHRVHRTGPHPRRGDPGARRPRPRRGPLVAARPGRARATSRPASPSCPASR